MGRRPSATRQRVVYRLDATQLRGNLENAIDETVLADPKYQIHHLRMAGQNVLLIYGTSHKRPPKWVGDIKELTGYEVPASTEPSSAVLIFEIADVPHAATFGHGRHILKKSVVERAFGLSVVLRAIDPDEITQVVRTVMDARGQTDRSTMTSGQRIRDYGIEGHGELVPKVVGKARDLRITALESRPEISLSGSESLTLPLGRAPRRFLDDLSQVFVAANSRTVPDDLRFIEDIRELSNRDPIVDRLWASVGHALIDDAVKIPLGVARPWPLDDREEEIADYQFQSSVRGGETAQDINLDLIRTWFTQGKRSIDWLRPRKIQARSVDGGTVPGGDTTFGEWLVSEVSIDHNRYFLHMGRWYRIDPDYFREVSTRVGEILRREPPIRLPSWIEGEEKEYNEGVEREDARFVCLDRKLTRSELHSRQGVETCDLFGPSGELIHVKSATSSSALSHLFAQSIVSTEQLLFERTARTAFATRVGMRASESSWVRQDARPSQVIFGIKLSRPLTSDSLFTFSKVTLLQADRRLARLDITVSVCDLNPAAHVPVPRHPGGNVGGTGAPAPMPAAAPAEPAP
jgi:uncharacterized protein (TIGR04141 family)